MKKISEIKRLDTPRFASKREDEPVRCPTGSRKKNATTATHADLTRRSPSLCEWINICNNDVKIHL